MLYQSPLLDRARQQETQNRFSIPRRGRIRAVLIFIIVGVSFWLYNQNATKPAGHEKDAFARNGRAKNENKTPLRHFGRKPAHAVKIHLPNIMTIDHVSELLRNYPPRLTGARDTIVDRGGGIIVHYSIDTSLQRLGREYLRRYHPKYGALVVLEPGSGRVLACVSYTNEEVEPIDKALFCRSIFPAASIFKTIAAAAAIEKAGLRAESMLRTCGANHTLYHSQLKKDLDNFREIPFKEAYAYSINPVFGRIGLYLVGADGLNEYALKFGFNMAVPFELHNEKAVFIYPESTFAVAEMASGFNQSTTISPLFGAMIAAGISNKGRIYAPTLVDSITDLTEGKRRYVRETVLWREPVDKQTAEELVLLMKDVARYGTARKSFKYLKQSYRFEDFDYGGKTGSVDKEGAGKVDWFVGFCRHKTNKSQHIATGVVTVHGAYWTVHSSFIGAEMMRRYIREVKLVRQETEKDKGQFASIESVRNTPLTRTE